MKYKTGVICGSFDVIHPGYIRMFQEAKGLCHELRVLVHVDPSIERSGKLSPVVNIYDRIDILMSLRQVDWAASYETEEQLKHLLQEMDYQVRFLGSDYIGKNYTKCDKDIPVVYLSREHGWSNTKLVELIVERGLPNGGSKEIPS